MQARRVRDWLCGGVLCVVLGVAPPAASDAPQTPLRLPAAIRYLRTDDQRPVAFDHTTHFGYAGGKCTACHPQPFSMLHPTHRVSHSAFTAGAQCGICHDGTKAFGTRDRASCVACHVPPPPAATASDTTTTATTTAPAPRAPGNVRFARSADSPGPVTFRHATHTGRAGTCATCHPTPFARKAGSTRGVMHDARYCGRCHDGSSTFGVEDADSCTKCHREAGAP